MNRLIFTVPVIALVAACGGSSTPKAASSGTAKISIGGKVVVEDVSLNLKHCAPKWRSANDDVMAGSTVTVYDAAGTVVAVSSLAPPAEVGTGFANDGCSYGWSASVPSSAFYLVQVGSHNKVTETRSKAVANRASLVLDAN